MYNMTVVFPGRLTFADAVKSPGLALTRQQCDPDVRSPLARCDNLQGVNVANNKPIKQNKQNKQNTQNKQNKQNNGSVIPRYYIVYDCNYYHRISSPKYQ
jgi:hypothetical protein